MKKFLLHFILVLTAIFLSGYTKEPSFISNEQNSIEKEVDFDEFGFEDEFSKQEDDFDPLKSYNEIATQVNDKIFTYVYDPVIAGYKKVLHENIRLGVANVFDNLHYPIRFANNILQLKFLNASEETVRFALNSTFGLVGLIDVGSKLGLQRYDEDFGQTLGYYGVGSGFHIVIPFYGPSNLRDFLSSFADSYINPLAEYMFYEPYKIPNNGVEDVFIRVTNRINKTSLFPTTYKELTKDAIDLYPFMKNLYEQRREQLIKE